MKRKLSNATLVILAIFFLSGCNKINLTGRHLKKESPYAGTSIERFGLHPSQKELVRKIVNTKLKNNAFEILVENPGGLKYFYHAVYVTGNKTECVADTYFYDVLFKSRKLNPLRCEFIGNVIEQLSLSKIGVLEINEQQCYDCNRDFFVYASTSNINTRILLKNVSDLDRMTNGCNRILYDYNAKAKNNKKDELIHKCIDYSMPEYACDESIINDYEQDMKQEGVNTTKCKLYSEITVLNDVVMAK